jgi:hypothetical protein
MGLLKIQIFIREQGQVFVPRKTCISAVAGDHAGACRATPLSGKKVTI